MRASSPVTGGSASREAAAAGEVMIYDVDIVAVPAQPILSLRGRGPISDLDVRVESLRADASAAGLQTSGPAGARFYEDPQPGVDPDYDVFIAVRPRDDGSVPDAAGRARGEWLPLHHVLQAVHHGPRAGIEDAWAAVREACSALGYAPAGPITEVYEVRADAPSPEAGVTLVRLPYAR